MKDFHFEFSYCLCKNNLKFSNTVHLSALIYAFKMHSDSDTTLLCSISPARFSEFEAESESSLPADAF